MCFNFARQRLRIGDHVVVNYPVGVYGKGETLPVLVHTRHLLPVFDSFRVRRVLRTGGQRSNSGVELLEKLCVSTYRGTSQ